MAVQTNLIDKQVGHRVSELRERAGVSSREAAILIGCSLDDYKMLEVGELRFKARQLIALSHRFGVPASAFLQGVEFPEPQGARRSFAAPIVSEYH